MSIINVYIPLKVRLTGTLTEQAWAELEERLTAQYSRALRRSWRELAHPRRPVSGEDDDLLIRSYVDPPGAVRQSTRR